MSIRTDPLGPRSFTSETECDGCRKVGYTMVHPGALTKKTAWRMRRELWTDHGWTTATEQPYGATSSDPDGLDYCPVCAPIHLPVELVGK